MLLDFPVTEFSAVNLWEKRLCLPCVLWLITFIPLTVRGAAQFDVKFKLTDFAEFLLLFSFDRQIWVYGCLYVCDVGVWVCSKCFKAKIYERKMQIMKNEQKYPFKSEFIIRFLSCNRDLETKEVLSLVNFITWALKLQLTCLSEIVTDRVFTNCLFKLW